MVVYHGTDSLSAANIVNNGIDIKYGEKSVDNGQGFYTTPNLSFALERAKTMTIAASKFNGSSSLTPAVIEIEISLPDNVLEFNILRIDGCTHKWKEFVLFNRLGKRFLNKWNITSNNHNLDSKYDIVIDETADAHITDMVSSLRYADSINNLDEIIGKVDRSDDECWDKQISFHTKKSLKCVGNMKILYYNNLKGDGI